MLAIDIRMMVRRNLFFWILLKHDCKKDLDQIVQNSTNQIDNNGLGIVTKKQNSKGINDIFIKCFTPQLNKNTDILTFLLVFGSFCPFKCNSYSHNCNLSQEILKSIKRLMVFCTDNMVA